MRQTDAKLMIRKTDAKQYTKQMLKFSVSLAFLFSVGLALLPMAVEGASLSVSPVIIDEKAKARDILKESVMLVNDTGRKLNVYTFVNNVAAEEGMATSLADWIEISRGVIELLPSERKKIDFKINVNLRSRPEIYHAAISFAEGSTRDIAETRLRQGFGGQGKLSGASSVMVNLEVVEDIKERLQLKKFIPDKILFSGFQAAFSYELENIGNQTLIPSGEIRIYDYRGKEVAAVGANQDAVALGPDTIKQFASIWQNAKGFGRYKALINLEYGAGYATVNDTVYFWLISWPRILMIFGGLSLISILIAHFLHRQKSQNRRKTYDTQN